MAFATERERARRTTAPTPETAAQFEELAGLAEQIEALAGEIATHANRVPGGEAVDAPALCILFDRLKSNICDAIEIHNSIDAAVQS